MTKCIVKDCQNTVEQEGPHCAHHYFTLSDEKIREGQAQQADLFDKPDNVNHPKHYTQHPSGVECIEITRHMSFNIGNAMKYLWRAGLKGVEAVPMIPGGAMHVIEQQRQKEIEDLQKAVWYIQDEIKKRRGQ